MDDLDLSDTFSDASDLVADGGDADIDSGAFFNYTDVPTDDTAFSSFDGLSTTQDLVNGDYTVQGVPVSDAPFDSTQAALVNGQTYPTSTDDAVGSLADSTDDPDDVPYDDSQPNPQAATRANPGALAQAGASVAKSLSTSSPSSGSIASAADAVSSLVKGTAAVAADVLSVTKAVQSAVNGKVNVKPASAMNVGTGSVSPAGTNGVQTMSPITIALVCGGVLLLAMAAKHG
jgi:hypothetical protein